jgi:hypothetical protein
LYNSISQRTQQPTLKQKISFCTDGNDQNKNAIEKYFNKDSVNFGQVIKDKIQMKIIGSHKRKILGNISYSDIKINKIDGFCSKLRARAGCLVRKTRNFAKKRKLIVNVLNITQTNHNFIEANKGKTPAIKEGLTKKIWTWNDIFNVRLSINV